MKKQRSTGDQPAPTPVVAPQPDKQPVVEHRLDRLVAVAVVTTYVNGQPVGEVKTQPLTFFRAGTPDVWGALTSAVQRAVDEQANGPSQNRPQPA